MGGSSGSQARQAPSFSGLAIQTSAQGKAIPIVYGTTRVSPNLIWYGDFVAIPQSSNPAGSGKGGVGGGGGGKGGGGSVSYIYQTAVALALCEGPIQGIGAAWADKNRTTPAALGLSVFTGTYPQTPWGYLTSKHPGQDLGYNGIAYAAGAAYQLGNSAQLPNHAFEVEGVFAGAAGTPDADPSLVVEDLLTNAHYGAGFPLARIGGLSDYQNYCYATGLFISPAYTDQVQAASILADIVKNTNSEFVWSSGVLTIVPYGDQELTGNGKTFTPDLLSQYTLTDDDFLENQASAGSSASTDPVLLSRKRPADSLNSIKLEFLDRNNQYSPAIAEAKDQAAIDLFGLRQDASRTAHLFASAAAANVSVSLQLQRELIRNVYAFTLGAWAIRLDPMDIVTLVDPYLFPDTPDNQQLVRIAEITENDDGTLSFTAEEFLSGAATATARGFQAGAGFSANYNDPPPATNAPILFAAPVSLAQNGLELWLAASGADNWGGCEVLVSSDGSTYRDVGRVAGAARQGVLTADFPSGSDPDTTDTLAVDLAMSGGQLLSGTARDADQGNTLCYVDGELVAYETATLTGANAYDLGTYLRRGRFGTPIAAHAAGAAFARLDDGIFKLPYTADQIGQQIFVKLPAFNVYGGGLQSEASATAYPVTLPAPPVPGNVPNFSAVQNGEVVNFAWGLVADNAITEFDIRYGPFGTSQWTAMLPLTESAKGTEMTNAAVPAGTWTFAIRAKDIAGQLSPEPTLASLQVVNTFGPISSIPQAPGWNSPGSTISGFVVHYSGVLVPDSTVLANTDTGTAVFDEFVWQPVATCSYEAPGVNFTKLALLRAWASVGAVLGPGETTGKANPLLNLRFSQTTAGDPLMWNANPATLMWNADPTTLMWSGISPYQLWTKGTLLTTFVQMKLVVNTSDGLPVVSVFTPTVDQPPLQDGQSGIVVGAGGSRIAFKNTWFLNAPFVSPAVAGGAAGSASASAIDADGFTGHVFSAAGSDVGGTLDYSAHN
jgi:hypothetical protein